jgi:hypothetical protein
MSNQLHLSTNRFDPAPCRLATSVHLDNQGIVNGALSQQFHPVSFSLYQPGVHQRRLVHYRASFKPSEISYVNNGVLFLKDICKPLFGQTTLQGHLAAFKSRPVVAARTALLTF